jgi:hypothetical protein
MILMHLIIYQILLRYESKFQGKIGRSLREALYQRQACKF